MIKYRPEIDGLRALAVVPVILFHADFSAFNGGFVGVDVFFVISGYLISTLILIDMKAGTFSFNHFYERRARRILPALFFVMLISIPFVWLVYLPADMKDYSESVASIPLFLSNFVFESQAGYFERATNIKPLIHTWSLAIEEQFYLFFPVVLVATLRWGKKWALGVVMVLFALSLVLAEWGSHFAPTDAYFLLPTRVWELLLGVLAATYLFYRQNSFYSGLGSLLGLSMIVCSVFIIDTDTPFPGIYALLPTVGTALVIIFTGPNTLVYWLLSCRSLVALGLISYSLYLWHQPIFAIVRYQSLVDLSMNVRLLMIVTAVILSVVSWKYLERPFRDRSRVSRKRLTQYGIGLSVFFIVFGIAGIVKEGDLGRFDDKTLAISNPISGSDCPVPQIFDGGCIIGDLTKSPTILVLGDSHAGVLNGSLMTLLSRIGETALLYSTGWCPPLINVTVVGAKDDTCQTMTAKAFGRALIDSRIKTVILHAEWANYTTGTRWGRRNLRFISDKNSTENSIEENQRVFERGIKQTASRLIFSGKKVVIIKSVPEYEVNVPNYLAKQFFKTGALNAISFNVSEMEYNQRNAGVEAAFSQLQPTPNLKFLAPLAVFCPDGQCQMIDDKGRVLYVDSSHLSLAGGNKLVSEIVAMVK